MNNDRMVEFRNTRFFFSTNFSGDEKRDPTFHSSTRQGHVVIADDALAQQLLDEGFNVKQYIPKNEDYPPEWHVAIKLNFSSRIPPTVCIVEPGMAPVRLDEESVHLIDEANDDRQVANVNVMCNKYVNATRGTRSLYIQTMYVEKSNVNDPYAHLYQQPNDDIPFDMGGEF